MEDKNSYVEQAIAEMEVAKFLFLADCLNPADRERKQQIFDKFVKSRFWFQHVNLSCWDALQIFLESQSTTH